MMLWLLQGVFSQLSSLEHTEVPLSRCQIMHEQENGPTSSYLLILLLQMQSPPLPESGPVLAERPGATNEVGLLVSHASQSSAFFLLVYSTTGCQGDKSKPQLCMTMLTKLQCLL